LRPYETLLLVDPRRTDQEIDETVKTFTTLVTERGGEMSNIERWGRRRLAYEIEHLTEGYYAVCTYNLESGKRAELEAALPFIEGLVRQKTVRRDVRTRSV
jgi:small subunit ribosomal protein S6